MLNHFHKASQEASQKASLESSQEVGNRPDGSSQRQAGNKTLVCLSQQASQEASQKAGLEASQEVGNRLMARQSWSVPISKQVKKQVKEQV